MKKLNVTEETWSELLESALESSLVEHYSWQLEIDEESPSYDPELISAFERILVYYLGEEKFEEIGARSSAEVALA